MGGTPDDADGESGDDQAFATTMISGGDVDAPAGGLPVADQTDRDAADAGPQVIPERIGKFKIRKKLGEGAMGLVLLGTDRKLNRDVAIKLLRGEGPAREKRLLREARTMAKVNHRNVVTVHEVDEFEGGVYVAMEFVEGQTLTEWFEEHTGWRERLAVLVEAGRGLAAAHASGLTHRDFKPDNVMVSSEGRVVVLDFGLAKASVADLPKDDPSEDLASVSTGLDLTRTGALLGTPSYMAPEQFMQAQVDERSDQFSFAIVCYRALFNERPFEGASVTTLGLRVVRGDYKPIPGDTEVPERVQRAIVRALSVSKDARFPDMDAMLAEFELERPAARRRGVLALALSGVGLLGVGAYLQFGGSDETPAELAAEQTEGSEDVEAIIADSNLPPEMAAPLEDDPLQVSVHRLDNGLTVYISPNPAEHDVHARVVVRAGGMHETSDQLGSAFLIERVLTTGTARLGTRDWASEEAALQAVREAMRDIDNASAQTRKAGWARVDEANQEAARLADPSEVDRLGRELFMGGGHGTGFDASNHDSVFVASHLELWAKFESERLLQPVQRKFPEILVSVIRLSQFFGHQRGAAAVSERTVRSLWGLPSTDDIAEEMGRARPEQLWRFYEDWYVPNNSAIVLTGNVDAERALPIVEKYFGPEEWRARRLPQRAERPRPDSGGGRTLVPGSDNPYMELAYYRTEAPTENLAALRVLGQALTEERTGLVSVALHEAGLAAELGAHVIDIDPYPLILTASVPDMRAYATANDAVREALEGVAAGKIDQAQLQAAKKSLARQQLEAGEDRWQRVDLLGESFARGRSWKETRAAQEEIDEVTLEQVQKVAAQLLEKKPIRCELDPAHGQPPDVEIPELTRAEVSPRQDFGKWATEILAERDALALEPRFAQRGEDYEVLEKPRGSLIKVRNESNGLFRLVLRLEHGTRTIPGVCVAVEAMEAGGVEGRGADLFLDLAALGAAVETDCDADAVTFELRGIDADLEATLGLLQDWIEHPQIDAAAVEAARKRVQDQYTRRYWNRGSTIGELAGFARFGRATDAHTLPDDRELSELTADDLLGDIAALRGAPRVVAYYGRQGLPVLVPPLRMEEAPSSRGEEAPEPLSSRKTTLYVLPTPGYPTAEMFVITDLGTIRADRGASVRLAAQVFGNSLDPQLDAMGLSGGYGSWIQWSEHPSQPTEFIVGTGSGTPDTVAAQLRAVETALASALPAEEALAPMVANYRRKAAEVSYTPLERLRVLMRWQELGVEGNADREMYEDLSRFESRELVELLERARKGPRVIALIADPQALPDLTEFGTVVEVSREDLFSFGPYPHPSSDLAGARDPG